MDDKDEEVKSSSSLEETSETSTPEPEDKRKKIAAAIVFGIAVIGLIVFMIFNFMGGSDPEEPTPTPTPTQSQEPTAPSTNGPSEPTENPTQPEPPSESDKAAVEAVAKEFVSKIKTDQNSQAWADSLKGVVSTAFYESLRVSEPKSIPNGGNDFALGDLGSRDIRVNVAKDDGGTAYSFIVSNLAVQPEDENAEAPAPIWKVTAIDLPEAEEQNLDENGYPIPPPVAPLSSDAYQLFYDKSFYVASAYLEFDAGESVQAREADLKKIVNNGETPALRPYNAASGAQVRMYGLEDLEVSEASAGAETKDGLITTTWNTSYRDTRTDLSVERVYMAVDFKWDSAAGIWKVHALRLIKAEPS